MDFDGGVRLEFLRQVHWDWTFCFIVDLGTYVGKDKDWPDSIWKYDEHELRV